MHIREALQTDLEGILAHWRAMIDEHAVIDSIYRLRTGADPDAATYFSKLISDESKLLIVADEHGRVEGYLVASLRSMPPVFEPQTIGLINELAVSLAVRRRGFGRALFARGREWLTRKGATQIEVRTLIGNPQSNAFWQSVGFQSVAVELRLKTAPGTTG